MSPALNCLEQRAPCPRCDVPMSRRRLMSGAPCMHCVLIDHVRHALCCKAMSLFLLFVWLEARQQQFPGKGRVRRARALAELVRSGRLTVGVP